MVSSSFCKIFILTVPSRKDFVKHTFALDEEVRTNMTNYELRDEDDELGIYLVKKEAM